jgi:hypothetical protein
MDRLRWDNIARAAALLGVIVLVVAWPHLHRHGPRLPSAVATPVSVEQEPAVAPPPRPKPARRKPPPRVHRAGHRAKRARTPRRVVRPRPAPPKAPPAPPRAPAAPPPPRAQAAPDDAAAREFAIP